MAGGNVVLRGTGPAEANEGTAAHGGHRKREGGISRRMGRNGNMSRISGPESSTAALGPLGWMTMGMQGVVPNKITGKASTEP